MVFREFRAGQVAQASSRHQKANAWDYGQVRLWPDSAQM